MKDKDIQEAETTLEIDARCPNCFKWQNVEWIDEYQDPERWVCANCQAEFKYRHPEA